MKTVLLENGEKVVVRNLSQKDSAARLASFINQLIRERAFVLLDAPVSLSEEKKWLRECLKEILKGDLIFLVVEKAGRVVGAVEARRGKGKEKNNVELAVALSKEVRGMGLGEYLLREVMSRASKKFKPRIIFLRCFGSNKPALNLYSKLGFVEITHLPNWLDHYGRLEDCVIMCLRK